MFEKLKALIDLFRQGQALANPGLWRGGLVTVNALAALILAIVNVSNLFGTHIPINVDLINQIASVVLGIVNAGVVTITSNDVGLPAKQVELAPVEMPKPDVYSGRDYK